jgi:hypothetical protein
MPARAILAQFIFSALIFGTFACSRSRSHPAGAAAGDPELALAGLATQGARKPLRDEEITPEIERRAKEILDAHTDAPVGTEIPFEVGDHSYVGRIEEHYNEPGGPRRPWGRHPGVTVYHAE